MVNSRPHNTDQLTGNIDRLRRSTLFVPSVPLLRAVSHLRRIVGRQGQALETTASGDGTGKDKIVQGKRFQGTFGHPRTLNGLIHDLRRWIRSAWIVASGAGVLAVIGPLELLDTGDKDTYTQWAHGEYIMGTDNT